MTHSPHQKLRITGVSRERLSVCLSAALLLLVSGRSLPTLPQRTARLLNQSLDANKLGSLSSLACSFNRGPGELAAVLSWFYSRESKRQTFLDAYCSIKPSSVCVLKGVAICLSQNKATGARSQVGMDTSKKVFIHAKTHTQYRPTKQGGVSSP